MEDHIIAEDIKKTLDITDFRQVSKDKLVNLFSSLHTMDREVAIKVLEQFPNFRLLAETALSHYQALFESIEVSQSQTVKMTMDNCSKTLEYLKELANRDDVSPEDRRFFAEKMLEVNDRIIEINRENNEYLERHTKIIIFGFSLVIVSAYVLLGGNAGGLRIPKKV